MPTDLELLSSIRSGYLTALAADAANPKPDYSIDGQTVSRAQWRESLLARIHDVDALIQATEPFELKGVIR